MATNALRDRFRRLFTAYLQNGRFPSIWQARLLIRKEGRLANSPSAYRPICLLDEARKLFERVIAVSLVEHLRTVGPNLAECQYGFREGRSTINAILRVKILTDEAVA